jgi:hypothetical protein
MNNKRRFTREDARALLDVARLDRTPPPPLDPERMMRCYVEILPAIRRRGRGAKGGSG